MNPGRGPRSATLGTLAILLLTGVASVPGPPASLAELTPAAEAFPVEMLRDAAERARLADDRALRFRCWEYVRKVSYSRGQARDEKSGARSYLLVREEGGTRYRALRRKSKDSGRWKDETKFPFPVPLAWSQLLDETLRERFRFEIGEEFTTPWRLAIPVWFEASGIVDAGRRIDEWTGTAWIEAKTGNVMRIEATPNYQEQRMRAEFQEWVTSFSFMGFRPFAKTPLGREILVDFDEEHEGLLYPSRVELRILRQVAAERSIIVRRTIIEYRGYEFFRSEADEDIGRPVTDDAAPDDPAP